MKKPINENYCFTVVKITNIIPLDNCDNVVHTSIFGNLVVVSKDTKINDIGLFIPPETEIMRNFLSANNLYSNTSLNDDPNKFGFFPNSGRVKTLQFRGHKSQGFFIPLSSLNFLNLPDNELPQVGDSFDELNGILLCRKFSPLDFSTIKNKCVGDKVIPTQFRFHTDTPHLGRNIANLTPDSMISITEKLHGVSGVSSYILCNKNLSLFKKILKKLSFNINDSYYDYIYSSRNQIKNPELNPIHSQNNIWELAHNSLIPFLQKGMTLYYEIVGYLPTGKLIQDKYDYSNSYKQFSIYIYRITHTNLDGQVFEFSAKQVQTFCRLHNLNPVPELFYGYAKHFFPFDYHSPDWNNQFLDYLSSIIESNCEICTNKVPREGVVIRLEGFNHLVSFKLKNFLFDKYESSLLDKNYIDLETEN